MRALPKHIYPHDKGYRIQIRRGGVLFSAFVACRAGASEADRTQALARAMAQREKFLRLAGPARGVHTKAHSNTGIAGISETMEWHQNRPIPCFTVWLGRKRSPQSKRFYFGHRRTRESALQQAIALRRSIGAHVNANAADQIDSFLDTEVLCG